MRWFLCVMCLVLCVGCQRSAAERPVAARSYSQFDQPFDEAVADDLGAPESDLDALFHRWDVDDDGALGRNELADPVFERFAVDGALSQPTYDAIARRWLGPNAAPMADWDADADGFLDRDEWRVAVGARHAEWDLNADDYVDARELRRGVHHAWDLDGDNIVSEEEMVFPAEH